MAAKLRSEVEIESSKSYFILQFFMTRNTLFPLGKIGTKRCLPRKEEEGEGGTGWYYVGFFSIYFTHLRLLILKLILNKHNTIFSLRNLLKAIDITTYIHTYIYIYNIIYIYIYIYTHVLIVTQLNKKF